MGIFKVILIPLSIAALVFAGYAIFVSPPKGAATAAPTLPGSISQSSLQGQNQDDSTFILQQLERLKTLTINGDIFNRPAYRALTDFGVEITAGSAGRINPFAPLPGRSSASGAALPSSAAQAAAQAAIDQAAAQGQ